MRGFGGCGNGRGVMHSFHRRKGGTIAMAICAAVPLLLGCDMVAGKPSIEGRMLHTPESFTGTATAAVTGDGDLTLVSDKGVRCGGIYRQVHDDNTGEIRVADQHRSGLATLRCDDGRTGSVLFDVGRTEAVGTGMLGQDVVTLTIAE
jgi:hypothetical protein